MSGLIYHSDKRRVLPMIERLEEYDDPKVSSPKNRIIQTDIIQTDIIPTDTGNILEKEIENWRKNKNNSKAGEIISEAFIDNRMELVKEIVDHSLKENPNDLFLSKIIHGAYIETHPFKRIANNRKILKEEPKDALTWTDQAINYLELGQREKALKAIECALAINSNNSFIVRNASRIFSLFGDNNRSIQILKRAEYYQFDPQILSAEISFSQLEGRQTKGIDYGIKILNEESYTAHQMTELYSAVGTFKFFKGDNKGAELLFDKALIDPNSNSLAQSLWYKKTEIPENKFLPYQNFGEIQTHRYTKDSDFAKAFKYSLEWKKVEPFSIRPYNLASYLSGVMLNDNYKAFEILHEGVEMQKKMKLSLDNEETLGYCNDLAYYLLRANKTEEAAIYLEPLVRSIQNSKSREDLESVEKATIGLYFFRIGNHDLGRKLYKNSISYFASKKQPYNLRSAFLNYFSEELKVNNNFDDLVSLRQQLDKIVPENSENDMLHFKKNVIIEFNEKIKIIK